MLLPSRFLVVLVSYNKNVLLLFLVLLSPGEDDDATEENVGESMSSVARSSVFANKSVNTITRWGRKMIF